MTTIRDEIKKDLKDYKTKEDKLAHLRDITEHGCESGVCSSLVYYKDTHDFYDKHYDEIEEIRQEAEDGMGQPLKVKGDLKNYMAWLGYEEEARKLLDEMESEKSRMRSKLKRVV